MSDPRSESERDQIIKEKLEERLSQEKRKIVKTLSPNAELSFDHETAYWNVRGSFNAEDPLGSQEFACSVRAGSPYSRAGILGGFRLNQLSVGKHVLFDQSTDDFDFTFVPPIPEDDDKPQFVRLLDEEAMLFDPDAGEILFYGLNKPEHLVGVLHEISHGRLERKKRFEIGHYYTSLNGLTNDISFAKERLESGDELTPEERSRFDSLTHYEVTEEDMIYIRGVLQEELRANLDLLDRFTPIASDIFPMTQISLRSGDFYRKESQPTSTQRKILVLAST